MKKNSKTPEIDKSDIEQKTRILLENIGSDVKRIAEVQTAAADDVSKMKKMVGRIPVLESEVKAVSMAVITLSGEVKNLTGDVKELKTDMKDLKNKVDENLSNHDKRITKLEEKVLL
jgi:chromosome segregation ATPase